MNYEEVTDTGDSDRSVQLNVYDRENVHTYDAIDLENTGTQPTHYQEIVKK